MDEREIKVKCRRYVFVFIFFLVLDYSFAYKPYYNQARIYNEDGHLYIVGGEHRNITLRSNGMGYLNVNDQNIMKIMNMAVQSAEYVKNFRGSILPKIQDLSPTNKVEFMSKISNLEIMLLRYNATTQDRTKEFRKKIRNLTNKVTKLNKSIRSLLKLSMTDECVSAPCQNGGTCSDLFNGFQCHCTPQWEGKICENDVNECEMFSGTDLGCKNGATCRNLKGSYACTCPSGWYGIHCTERTFDCTRQSSAQLCGNGICVNQGGTGHGFVCICNDGWSTNTADGACTVDKDECQGPNKPCSHDPLVECRNLPGSFTCGPCPAGYSGNGFQCTDIDECQVNNGGCSISPMVQCVNTRGSRTCGLCPPGYMGDGVTCTRTGRCQLNNGGCHPIAICQDNSALSYIECQCPAGYTGNGVGVNGCMPAARTACDSSPCANGGTCFPSAGGNYTCKCPPTFIGANCSARSNDPCSSSPCLNGGKCQNIILVPFGILYYRCRCPEGFSGLTCANEQKGCVETFSGQGSMSWPLTNQSMVASKQPYTCAWTIITDPDKVINLTFTQLTFQSRSCFTNPNMNYVQVHEGSSSSGTLIGKYCELLPPSIISTYPSLYILAKIKNTSKLKFNWTSVAPRCGGEIDATIHGTIFSPGSPGSYPKNLNCIWKLSTHPGQRIQLTFFSLDIEVHANCSFDYLEIRDGDTEYSPILRRLCTSNLPAPLMTSSNHATLIFHTDVSGSGKGFQLAYGSREGVPGCGGTFTSPTGQFSPGDGVAYDDNLNCEWRIELPLGEKIEITIDSFSLEESAKCKFDSLEVYDGPTKSSGLIGRWCGKAEIPLITSTTNIILVVFHSDVSKNEGGFVLSYMSVCGGTWSAEEGEIHSPYYPNHYPGNRLCKFTIERPLGTIIKLDFIDLDIEKSTDCLYDKLMIYDGYDDNSPLIGTYCGGKKPGRILSTHNILYFTLETDNTRHGRGFMANYSSIDVDCGGILTKRYGNIVSPRFPDDYLPGKTCVWLIATAPGTMIQLNWVSFNVKLSFRCERDWVQIFDNNTVSSMAGQMGERYCGTIKPPPMTSTSNLMTIVFNSSTTSKVAPGFMAAYTAIDGNSICGGDFYTTMGSIKSPDFPSGYGSNLDCRWTITVPHGQQIELTPVSFQLQNGECSRDYLEIRNGGFKDSPLIKSYCETNFKNSIISMANQLYLRFVSDVNKEGPGFMLRWNGALTGCGGTLSSPRGAIMSPNYPQPYGRNGECTWKISVSQGSVINFAIVDMDLEDHSQCRFDYLEFFDGPNQHAPRIARLCDESAHPVSLNSNKSTAFLKFRSDTSRQGRGFHIKYNTVCNITLTGHRGVIENPGFPDDDEEMRLCIWKIKVPHGNKVNISFSHFDVDDQLGECEHQYIKIKDEVQGTTTLLCNNNKTDGVFTSSSNTLDIEYKSYYPWFSFPNKFRLEWTVSGCGGILKGVNHGVITSPNYPNPYPIKVHCEWYISVPLGNSIKLTVDDLKVENTDNCEFDALEVYGGPDSTSPNLAILCEPLSSQMPSIITTSGNSAFVRFKSDVSSVNIGFHAFYDMVPSSCGGVFAADQGSIHSHHYPQNYEPHDDCAFLITINEAYRVNLTFTDFKLHEANCNKTYVKVYDGNSTTAPLLTTLCGDAHPAPILASGNTMYLHHKVDGFFTSKGFYANFKAACGAIYSTDSIGTINFIQSNWLEEECMWIIRSTLPSSKIRLQFTLLEIISDTEDIVLDSDVSGVDNASRTGVTLLSGEGVDAPFLANYARSRLPQPILAPSSTVTVLFKSDSYGSVNRFILDYSVLDTACGGSLTSESGTIVSPSSPDPYPNNAECIWKLLVAPGNKLIFEFTKFSLQESNMCNVDYLEIRMHNETGSLVGVYCGSTLPKRIQANSTLWIKFRSGLEGTAPGFIAEFSLLKHSDLYGNTGQIGSPFYPISFHQSRTYSWRVTVSPRHAIEFSFSDFYIETFDESYCYNKLMIFDGYDNTAPLLKKICGYSIPETFRTESNMAYIMMINNNGEAHFLFNWLLVSKGSSPRTQEKKDGNCSEIVELKRGANSSFSFSSPGYPHGYASHLRCTWIFQVPIGDHVQISFEAINLERTHRCSSDSITLFNGEVEGSTEEWVQTDKICRQNDTEKYYSGSRIVKVLFHSDYSVNRTGFKGQAKAVCGGSIINVPNGVLTDDGPWRSCQWNITVKPGRRINITFEKFLVRGDQPCTLNYIFFRDGGGPESPYLGTGKYCGDKIITVPETTSNRLYIYYKATNTEGFVMRFQEKSTECGGTIMLNEDWRSTSITSPNYPNVPPPHTECVWVILAPSGESIHFEVSKRFDLQKTKGCTSEYLELRDGSSENSHFIGRYCSRPPSFVVTEGNAMYIKYFTDIDLPKDGFNATISLSKCGGTIYTADENGTIYSPGYPQSYDGYLNCTWKLVANEWKIYSVVLNMSMGREYACNKSQVDYITVAEYSVADIAIEGPESITYCGTRISTVISETNEIIINFVSLKQKRYGKRLFSIFYKEKPKECGGELELSSGEVKSPLYPRSFAGHTYCQWRITVPEGRRVTFTLFDLDLEVAKNRSTPQFLSFFNGFQYNKILTLSGSIEQPKVIESSGNKMMISYRSLFKTTHRGFYGNFTSYQSALCGGVIKSDKNGNFTLHEDLQKPDRAFSCEWKFMNDNRSLGTITFFIEGIMNPSSLSGQSSECVLAHSSIIISDTNMKKVGEICDSTTVVEYTLSKPNDMTLLKARKSIWKKMDKKEHFTITWKIDTCGLTKQISSPLIIANSGTYVSGIDCVWSVSVMEGSAVKIKFNNFDMGSNCTENYLRIYNGNGPTHPTLLNHCGSIIPADIISHSTTVWIHFHSGRNTKKIGFSLEVSPADAVCGGILSMKHGEISTPNPYKNNMECEWEIHAPLGYHIGLVFKGRFFIEDSPKCEKDSVEVSEFADGSWKVLSTLCGRTPPSQPFNSTTNKMKVTFKSNNKIAGDGFQAVFDWNCGGVIPVKIGQNHLYSPGWPNSYPPLINCTYKLRALGETISLKTEVFNLEPGTSLGCTFDKLQFFTRERQYHSLESNGIYCGSVIPPPKRSAGELEIQFSTDDWGNYRGFHLIYGLSRCGGEIRNETVITKPPQDFRICKWNIVAPKDKIVIIEVSKLKILRSYSCYSKHIAIYDTSNGNSTLLGKICGHIYKPVFFKTTGNSARIEYRNNFRQNSEDFRIIVSYKYGETVGCGGTISVDTDTTLSSPDIDRDGNYEDNMHCIWVVSTSVGKRISVEFQEINFAPCQNITNSTCCDGLEVYDGNSVNGNLMASVCGNQVSRTVSSSGSYLTLKFVSDDINHSKGFKVKFSSLESLCGPSILEATNTPKFLTSPNYPNSYPINSHCYWLIRQNNYQPIDIHFLDMEIEKSVDCSNDRIELTGSTQNRRFFPPPFYNNQRIFRNRIVSNFPMQSGDGTVNKFCGNWLPLDYYSSANTVAVRFISDSQYSLKGFKIQYSTAGCTRNYTSPQGRVLINIQNSNCNVTITAPENTTISLYFNKLSLYRRAGNCVNSLRLFEGGNKTNEVCGYIPPNPIYSKSNILMLSIISSMRMRSNIDITYTSTDKGQGCGGKLYNYVGIFTSPFYPGNRRNNSYCCWDVVVPLPNVVKLVFTAFDIGLRATCNTDYVEIFDYDDSTGGRVKRTTYCGGDKPAQIFSRGQGLSVCYKSSVNNNGIGWKATFNAHTTSSVGPALQTI